MHTVLVANRGEIALRVFRTARRMGMRCVAVYSEADADAPHVRAADEAFHIGPPPATDSYLRAEGIIAAARRAGADLVHPGYGFLAEDPRFAEACEAAGIGFVGPPPTVLRSMGDKGHAKVLAEEAGVPTLPGYAGDDQSDEALARAASDIGYPVLVKPAAGGGGKGMTVVREPGELPDALASARRIAAAAFGDDRLLLERYLDRARHIEVQILGDAHGGVVHLGERDCTVQRRHQKILEETPSPAVDTGLRTRLCDAAVAFARHVGYRSAGTFEFLLGDDTSTGFIEANARLQVEHPVTELVTGLDLVELQLHVALGGALPVQQEDVTFRGHAIEARIYAEDPDEDFLPQSGRVVRLVWPSGARVDAGIEQGSVVSPHYDPLLAKLVVGGSSRGDALGRLRDALDATVLLGPRTNLGLLGTVARDPAFGEATVTTGWLESAYAGWRSAAVGEPPEAVLAAAAAAEAARLLPEPWDRDPWSALGPWRVAGRAPVRVVLRTRAAEGVVGVEREGPSFRVSGTALPSHASPFTVRDVDVRRGRGGGVWLVDGEEITAVRDGDVWLVWCGGVQHEIAAGPRARRLEETETARLGAPLPGRVAAVRIAAGDAVRRGQELVVVEAMKMEHTIKAPADGVVARVICARGDQVERDQPLVEFEPAG